MGEGGRPPSAVILDKSPIKKSFSPILQDDLMWRHCSVSTPENGAKLSHLDTTVSVKGHRVGRRAPTSPATRAPNRLGAVGRNKSGDGMVRPGEIGRLQVRARLREEVKQHLGFLPG